jgi:hypothetical protein
MLENCFRDCPQALPIQNPKLNIQNLSSAPTGQQAKGT